MSLELDDVRRLTGPNLLWDKPGAIADVFIKGEDTTLVLVTWKKWVDTLQGAIGWQHDYTCRIFEGGASLALSSPMDALYAACEILELAWHCAVAELNQQTMPNWQAQVTIIQSDYRHETNPQLIALMDAAKAHKVTLISDDDHVSLGMGKSTDVFPARELPASNALNWDKYTDIPRAFITGTNGKSTSVRLAACIAQAAGINAGVTSTDFIKVGEHIIDTGDYSGPGGARMLLRDSRTEMAFLEVARGGILRRGLPLESVDAALITNVASDHLGQYGINTVSELATTKFVVAKGINPTGMLVVNADNTLVVQQAASLRKPLCWFSVEESNPLIQQQLNANKAAVFVRDSTIVYSDKGIFEPILDLKQIPITLGGAAQHNVQNALGVVGLCIALGISYVAIRKGLQQFGNTIEDNPGRGNVYHVNGATIIVDFAHNEHSMQAIVATANQLPCKQSVVMFSHAGDRSDAEIHDLTSATLPLKAKHYVVAEVEQYLRGREVGDIPRVASATLQRNGVSADRITIAKDPLDGARYAISKLSEGDLALLFVLADREEVQDYLLSLEKN